MGKFTYVYLSLVLPHQSQVFLVFKCQLITSLLYFGFVVILFKKTSHPVYLILPSAYFVTADSAWQCSFDYGVLFAHRLLIHIKSEKIVINILGMIIIFLSSVNRVGEKEPPSTHADGNRLSMGGALKKDSSQSQYTLENAEINLLYFRL